MCPLTCYYITKSSWWNVSTLRSLISKRCNATFRNIDACISYLYYRRNKEFRARLTSLLPLFDCSRFKCASPCLNHSVGSLPIIPSRSISSLNPSCRRHSIRSCDKSASPGCAPCVVMHSLSMRTAKPICCPLRLVKSISDPYTFRSNFPPATFFYNLLLES